MRLDSCLVKLAALLCAASALGFPTGVESQTAPQIFTYEVLIDSDRTAATGCSVTPSGGATQEGIEQRLTATVEINGGSGSVTALERRECTGGSFGAPIPVSPPIAPWPVNFNGGIAGSDVVELAVDQAAIIDSFSGSVALIFVGDNGTGSDVLATVDGSPDGTPIVFSFSQPLIPVPLFSLWGLVILLIAMMGLAWLASRRLGKIGTAMTVMLVATAVWAMNFAVDGDLGDWTGLAPAGQDPTGDASNSLQAIDLVAGFAAAEGGALYFRIDVVDLQNTAPDATDDAYNVDEDNILSEPAPGLLGNDTDIDFDPLTAVLVTGPANAQSFTLNADGSFDCTPNTDFNGTDSFTYLANDGQSNSAAALVTITVAPIDDGPVALGDSAVFTEDDPATTINVLANDTDIDGGPISVVSLTQPADGTVVITNAGADLSYQPDADFCNDGSPSDDFSYTLNGGASATVMVTVDCVNDNPVLTFPTPGVEFDSSVGPVTLDTAATLTDVDSTTFSNLSVSRVSIAPMVCDALDQVTVEDQGSGAGQIGFDGTNVSYEGTPIGSVSQPYLCTDPGNGISDALEVTLNDAPQAATQALARALQFTTSSANADARTVTVSVTDTEGGTAVPATQSIILHRAPTAVADAFTVGLGAIDASNSVLDNDDRGVPAAVVDFYADTGDIGGASQVSAPNTYIHPTGGFGVTIDASGNLTVDTTLGGITPGVYDFGYQITNTFGSSVATVTVEIDQRPIAVDDDFTVAFDAPAPQFNAVDLLSDNGNGADIAGSPVFDAIEFGGGSLSGAVTDNFFVSPGSITVPFAAAGGALTISSSASGTLDFSLAGTTNGTDLIPGVHTFLYQLTNSAGTSSPATVTLTITN